MKNIRTNIRSVVAGYNDGTLRIFNLLHGQMVLKLHPHTSSITAINVPLNSLLIRKCYFLTNFEFFYFSICSNN